MKKSLKKSKIIIRVLAIVIAIFIINYNDFGPVSANDFKSAETIQFGGSKTISFKETTDHETYWYKFTVPSIGAVKLNLHSELLHFAHVDLYDANQKACSSFSAAINAYASNDYVDNRDFSFVANPGTYYLKCTNETYKWVGSNMVYQKGTLRLTLSFEKYDVSSIDTFDNDKLQTASNWDYKSTPSFTGSFPRVMELDYKDWYRIDVKSKEELQLRIGAVNDSFFAYLYDENGNKLKDYGSNKSNAKYRGFLDELITLDKGVYYLCISNFFAGDFKYDVYLGKKIVDDNADDKSTGKKPSYSNEWVNGQWYDKDGKTSYKAKGSWKSDSNGWWYVDAKGWYPTNSWLKIDGNWYYFTASGYMDYSEYRDGCWLNADGTMNPNYTGGHWCSDNNGWWYEDNGWYPCNQYVWIDGVEYWFSADGYWR